MRQESAFTEEGLAKLAEIVKIARGGRTFAEFQRMTDISYMTIQRLENMEVRTPEFLTLQKLAKFTPYSAENLLAIATQSKISSIPRKILTAEDVMPYVIDLPLPEIGRLIQRLGEIIAVKFKD